MRLEEKSPDELGLLYFSDAAAPDLEGARKVAALCDSRLKGK